MFLHVPAPFLHFEPKPRDRLGVNATNIIGQIQSSISLFTTGSAHAAMNINVQPLVQVFFHQCKVNEALKCGAHMFPPCTQEGMVVCAGFSVSKDQL